MYQMTQISYEVTSYYFLSLIPWVLKTNETV